MKRILEFNEKDLDITVEAGLGYLELNDILREKNMWFPLDPGNYLSHNFSPTITYYRNRIINIFVVLFKLQGPGASMGGMCACRCSGSTAVRYGSMRENVFNVTAVLHDGTIMKTGSRARKSSAGYDLTRLLIGSEGTLAVITEVTLKLHMIPSYSYSLRISFADLDGATATARDTLTSGITVGRCELLDSEMVDLINRGNSTLKPWDAKTTLLYEITGISEASVIEQAIVVEALAKKNGSIECVLLTEPQV